MRRHDFGGRDIFADDLIGVQGGAAPAPRLVTTRLMPSGTGSRVVRQAPGDRVRAVVRQAVMHDDGRDRRAGATAAVWDCRPRDRSRSSRSRPNRSRGRRARGSPSRSCRSRRQARSGRESASPQRRSQACASSTRVAARIASDGPAEPRARRDREMMRGLRIEPERERTNEGRVERHGRIISTSARCGATAAVAGQPTPRMIHSQTARCVLQATDASYTSRCFSGVERGFSG